MMSTQRGWKLDCVTVIHVYRIYTRNGLSRPHAAPAETDRHYEKEYRLVWNDKRRTNEEHIFVYEVSWTPELGVWRWFLPARGVMPAGGEVCTAKKCV